MTQQKKGKKKIKFICLPGGGTSSVVFYKWFGMLDPGYRPGFIDLPGRGLRKKEEPLTDIDSAAADLLRELQKHLEDGRDEEYVLFAYCMGSIFLWELLKKIRDAGMKMPLHLFLVAADVPCGEMYRIPFLVNPTTKMQFYDLIRSCFPEHSFPDSEALKEFRIRYVDLLYQKYEIEGKVQPVTVEELRTAGCSEELLQSFEFTECLVLANDMMKIMSIDCEICSRYQRECGQIEKADCDITCITGSEDHLYSEDVMKNWEEYAAGNCRVFVVEGGHRILLDANRDAVAVLNQRIPSDSPQ